MPKLTNKCAICGKPILKSATICATCIAKKEARQREIDQQQEVYNIRLQSELLWEKRRYEIAKEIMPHLHIGSGCSAEQDAAEAVRIADALIAELKKEDKK